MHLRPFAVTQKELETLTIQYEQAEAEKTRSAAEVAEASNRLSLAQRLIRALAEENTRWAESVDELAVKRRLLTGDVLLGMVPRRALWWLTRLPHCWAYLFACCGAV